MYEENPARAYQALLNEILELIVDTVCTKRKLIRIASDDKPAEVVKSKFMKLTSDHIEYVLGCFKENTTDVRNVKQYLLAAIYNAPLTIYPQDTWFRLALLEAMLFEPYFPLTLETDKKGNAVPSKKYAALHNPVSGYSKGNADQYLDSVFPESYYTKGYIKRLRKCHGKVIRELNEVLKTALTSLAITAAVTIATIATAGAFAPSSLAVILWTKNSIIFLFWKACGIFHQNGVPQASFNWNDAMPN